MSLNYKTPDYFRDFQCLGGDCPDTCCQHWEVKLDRSHYLMLKEKMSQHEEEKERFDKYIRINEQPVTGDHDYAFIYMNDEGHCPMLDEQTLCSLHARHGIEPLGNVCAFYPRVISRCGKDMELSGALSCPEVARLCLQAEHPHRLQRFNVSQLPRSKNYPIQRELPQNPFDYYAENFQHVRQALLDLAAREDTPLNVRLYSLIDLAHTLSGYYHRDCHGNPLERLNADIAHAQKQETLNTVAHFLKQDDAVNPLALIVVRAILEIKIQRFEKENLSRLANAAFAGFGTSTGAVEKLQAEYDRRRQDIAPALQTIIDACFTRYLCNCLFREWFFTMPDTFTYMQMLLIRLAMLRYLLYGQPRFRALASLFENAGEEEQMRLRQELESLLIELVYNFARDVDQNLSFLQLVYTAISEQDMFNFDYSLAFVRF